jgi:hypothetical protein
MSKGKKRTAAELEEENKKLLFKLAETEKAKDYIEDLHESNCTQIFGSFLEYC